MCVCVWCVCVCVCGVCVHACTCLCVTRAVCVIAAVVPIGVDLDTLTTGSLDGPEDGEEETSVFDKHDDLLHGIQMGKKWVEGEGKV